MRGPGFRFPRFGVLSAIAMLLGGCEGTDGVKNVSATYRFENVRQTATLDEWTSIRQILNRHTSKPVTSEIVGSSTNGGVRVSTYQAEAVLRDVESIDLIEADLEALSSKRVAGTRIQFALAKVTATYRSNALAAGVEVHVAGVANVGYTVRVYQNASTPIETVADRYGTWTVRLGVVPETRWVYGVSLDPKSIVPPRYFRVDLTTQKQEDLDEAEFHKVIKPAQRRPPENDGLKKPREAEAANARGDH